MPKEAMATAYEWAKPPSGTIMPLDYTIGIQQSVQLMSKNHCLYTIKFTKYRR